MERFGVGLFSWSSADPPPNDDLDPFLTKRGDEGGLLRLAELDARRPGACCGRGELLAGIGDVAGCDVRRAEGVLRRGVGGAEELGECVSVCAAVESCLGASGINSLESSVMACFAGAGLTCSGSGGPLSGGAAGSMFRASQCDRVSSILVLLSLLKRPFCNVVVWWLCRGCQQTRLQDDGKSAGVRVRVKA